MGTFRRFASASASGPHGHQSTGLSACWSRYGLVALARRFMRPGWHPGKPGARRPRENSRAAATFPEPAATQGRPATRSGQRQWLKESTYMFPRPSTSSPASPAGSRGRPGRPGRHRGRRLYQRRSFWAAVVLAVVGGSVAVVNTASAAVVDPKAWYVLVNRTSGEALDGLSYATYDGAAVVQWGRHGGANQQWRFIDSGDGYYRLQNRNSGNVLDDFGWSKTAGSGLVQWADRNGANQQFHLKKSSDGHVRLINRFSGMAVEVQNGSKAAGGRVAQQHRLGRRQPAVEARPGRQRRRHRKRLRQHPHAHQAGRQRSGEPSSAQLPTRRRPLRRLRPPVAVPVPAARRQVSWAVTRCSSAAR